MERSPRPERVLTSVWWPIARKAGNQLTPRGMASPLGASYVLKVIGRV